MTRALIAIPLVVAVGVGIVERSLATGVLAFYLAALCIVLIGWAANREWPRRGRRGTTLHEIDAMDGVEFESYIAARLGSAGWDVTFTPPVGDFGVDLVAQKDGHYVAVQCKRYGKPVGISAVQEVVSGARHHGCTRSIVVSNQEFTPAAKQLARTHNCQLIGRTVLQSWVRPPELRPS